MLRTSCIFSILLLLIAVHSSAISAEIAANDSPSDPKHVRILTVGNSFTHNATRYLDDLVQAAGHKLTQKMLSIGGSPLDRHASMALAYEKDPKDPAALYASDESLPQVLQSENWDVVTIQQASIKSHDVETYRPYAQQLADIVHRYAPQAQLLVHQTWAYRQDDPRFATPPQAAGEPATQTAMYEGISHAYRTITAELSARRIPVGDAFWMADNDDDFGFRASDDFDASQANHPALPDQMHSLHVGYRWLNRSGQQTLGMDGHHANLAGEYLGACVWFECLFGESPVGNAFVPDKLDPEYAAFLQSVAHRAVAQADDAMRGLVAPIAAAFNDATPQLYKLQVRASAIDPQAREYPEIDFVFGSDEKPADMQFASVDTRVDPQGKLTIWLMGHNAGLFERLNSYGIHAIGVSYARQWFGTLCHPAPSDAHARGRVRLEAATGLDFSDELDLQLPDGVAERTRQMLLWLSKEHPAGKWEQFLADDGSRVRWDKVLLSGASHGSTTAARFAQYQRVDRVVMLCGPRDQDQAWQGQPSVTPTQRFFGFTHVLDGGWTGHHYDRSWELLGLQHFGPIVNIDSASPPYQASRRLITAADVGGDAGRAHSSVTPGGASPENANGVKLFEPVWEYLFNHPVGEFAVVDSSAQVSQ